MDQSESRLSRLTNQRAGSCRWTNQRAGWQDWPIRMHISACWPIREQVVVDGPIRGKVVVDGPIREQVTKTDQSGCTHVLVDQSESREGMCGYKLTNQREGIHLNNCQWTEGELWVVEWRVTGYTCHLWLHYLFGGSEHICACYFSSFNIFLGNCGNGFV